MPTPTKGPRLGGGPAHERLMLANLATSLFEHDRITTTEGQAKRLRPLAERLVTFAKRGDLHARRRVMTVIRDKGVVHRLFAEIAPDMAERPGGYTRITKIGPRKGDNAPMAVIELVREPVAKKATVKEAEAATKRAAKDSSKKAVRPPTTATAVSRGCRGCAGRGRGRRGPRGDRRRPGRGRGARRRRGRRLIDRQVQPRTTVKSPVVDSPWYDGPPSRVLVRDRTRTPRPPASCRQAGREADVDGARRLTPRPDAADEAPARPVSRRNAPRRGDRPQVPFTSASVSVWPIANDCAMVQDHQPLDALVGIERRDPSGGRNVSDHGVAPAHGVGEAGALAHRSSYAGRLHRPPIGSCCKRSEFGVAQSTDGCLRARVGSRACRHGRRQRCSSTASGASPTWWRRRWTG